MTTAIADRNEAGTLITRPTKEEKATLAKVMVTLKEDQEKKPIIFWTTYPVFDYESARAVATDSPAIQFFNYLSYMVDKVRLCKPTVMTDEIEERRREFEQHHKRLVRLVCRNSSGTIVPEKYGLNEDLEPVRRNNDLETVVTSWHDLGEEIVEPVHSSCTEDGKPFFSPIGEQMVKLRIIDALPIEELVDWVEIASGEDIYDVFSEYRPGSCMRYDHCQPWLDIYANNPGDVDCLYVTDRSLFDGPVSWLRWKGNSNNYFDAAYYDNGADVVDRFRNRIASSFGVRRNEPIPRTFRLRWNGNNLPYIDTYRYIRKVDRSAGLIWLSSESQSGDLGECTDHENGTEPFEPVHCMECGDAIDTENDSYHCDDSGDYYCCHCYAECSMTMEDMPRSNTTHVQALYCPAHHQADCDGYIRDVYVSDDWISENTVPHRNDESVLIHDVYSIELQDGTHVTTGPDDNRNLRYHSWRRAFAWTDTERR